MLTICSERLRETASGGLYQTCWSTWTDEIKLFLYLKEGVIVTDYEALMVVLFNEAVKNIKKRKL